MDLDFISHYRIVQMIGSGGMGEVYLAEDPRLKRKVAVKLLRVESSVNTIKTARFEKEARAASALNHPNIVTVFDVGQTDSFHYMVTEFVDGQTLREYFCNGPVTIKKAAEITINVAEALEAAHSAGIIHRDIKPENIMIRSDGVVKVLDFGLAKLIAPKDTANSLADTTPGLIMGTPRYMSPEQVRGQDVDSSTDVYSLGAVFYEMIAGHPPFDDATVGDTIAAVLTRQPLPLDRQNPDTPPVIQKIIERCLNKDRELRYRTMDNLISELEAAIDTLQDEIASWVVRAPFAEQPTILERTRDTGKNTDVPTSAKAADTVRMSLSHRVQRRPILSSGLAAAVLAVLALSGLWFVSGGRETLEVGTNVPIPVRVIDPLGGEDESDIDDLQASWERAEEELTASDIGPMNQTSRKEKELNVSVSFFEDRKRKALEDRPGAKGVRPSGLEVPVELFADGVVKQRAKINEMFMAGYRPPMDFIDMAEKWYAGELIELPVATRGFYLDVGGSASTGIFTSFSFSGDSKQLLLEETMFDPLKALAENFSGERYSLDEPLDRQQIRRRLLRMLHPRARAVLYQIAEAYNVEYVRPLRITALTRPIDFQILLSSTNPDEYQGSVDRSTAPHLSGLSFDIARTDMPVDEQNFVMEQLARMEQEQLLDAVIIYGHNASFHVFVY